MKSSLARWLIVWCGCLVVLSWGVTVARSQESGPLKVTQAQGEPAKVRAGKKAEWGQVQKRAEKEYQMCIEHCGVDADCVAKCDKALQAKLDRGHQKLLSE